MEHNEIRSTLVDQNSPSPPLPNSKKPKGGWRSIKYILGKFMHAFILQLIIIFNDVFFLILIDDFS